MRILGIETSGDETDFFHGLAGVLAGRKWGFVDGRGVYVIGAQFDEVRDFLDGLAPVRIGRKWGYIDTTGRMEIEPRFQAAGEFHEGAFPREVTSGTSINPGRL